MLLKVISHHQSEVQKSCLRATLNLATYADSTTYAKKKSSSGQKQTKIEINKQKQTETDRNKQKWTEPSKNMSKLTETDRNSEKQTETTETVRMGPKRTETDKNGHKRTEKKTKNVMCQVSHVTFLVLRVACHMSLTPTATAKKPSPF